MKKTLKYLKIIITIAIPCVFIWFLIIYPYLGFKNNEKAMEQAARNYYDINIDKLPTGKRVATLTLKELYSSAYLKKDFYVPYSKKVCSISDSWIKVKQNENGVYEYYPYLDCGTFKSKVDHKGPTITLKGENEITINKGEKYEDPGIKSIKDNTDGAMDIKTVTIDSSKVNTNKNGTYEVTYTAFDSLKNKTTITRKVTVVQKLNKTVKEVTGENNLYQGTDIDNYILFSGMLFRIIGIEGDNVKIVSATDIASINYDAINEWLDYFYDHIAKSSKDLVVKNKYCSDKLEATDINSNKTCTNKTQNRNVYLLSNKEINESRGADGDSYLFPETINWTANALSETHAWTSKYSFIPYESGTQFYGFSKDYNFGIRPVLTIKGNALVKSGDGTEANPYFLGDIKRGKAGEYLSSRYSGEYITYSGQLWRIVETTADGYTKVITESPIELAGNSTIKYETEDASKIYNPTQRGNIGYTINKKTSDNINEKYFVTKEITAPVYKGEAKFGEEIKSNKYKVKFSAPNMYEMFSGPQENKGMGYWLINSSEEEFRKYAVSNVGIVIYDQLPDHFESYIRPVGFLDKKVKIVLGSGTKKDPYKISK